MKHINTGFVVDPSIQQPLTTKSLDFLQKGNKEMVEALCRNIISTKGYTYLTTIPYYIAGIDSTPFPSDGAIFFNNELYILTENVASYPYAIIDVTPDTLADPLLFTDAVPRNVHDNRFLTYTTVAAGALFALANIVDVSSLNGVQIAPTLLNSWTSFTTPMFSKVGNVVTLQGLASKLSGSTGTIFQLPAGYVPLVDKRISCVVQESGTTYSANLLQVDTSGNVALDHTTGLNTIVCFDGLSFII